LIGQDFARQGDLSVVSLLLVGDRLRHIARLEMRDVSSPEQRRQMERLIKALGHRCKRVCIDMTGNGTGLAEELADRYGSLILPVHFGRSVEMDEAMRLDGDKRGTMPIPERMAIDLARAFDDGLIEIPDDSVLLDDLRKPYRVQSGNRVSIAAAKTAEGHADRFWSIALALHGHYTSGFGAWTAQDVAGAVVGGVHDVFDPFSGVGAIQW
jgi:phage FluMu gp28-like protein